MLRNGVCPSAVVSGRCYCKILTCTCQYVDSLVCRLCNHAKKWIFMEFALYLRSCQSKISPILITSSETFAKELHKIV